MADHETNGRTATQKRLMVQVYGKDLHQDTFSKTIRFDSEQYEHGDRIMITAELLEDTNGEEASAGDGPPVPDEE